MRHYRQMPAEARKDSKDYIADGMDANKNSPDKNTCDAHADAPSDQRIDTLPALPF